MVAEEFFFDAPPLIPVLNSKQWMRRLVLRGEDQSHAEAGASPGREVDLGDGEIFDTHDAERLTGIGIGIGIDIAQPWPGEFVRCGPGGENALAGKSQRQEPTDVVMCYDAVA